MSNAPMRLARNVGGSIAFALLVDGAVFALGWNRASEHLAQPPLSPPDALVATVWVALFAAMGYARFRVVRDGSARDARLVLAMIVACALYPLYTLGLSNLAIATAGNLATALAALTVAALVRRSDAVAAACLVPVAAWTAFATYLTVGTIIRNA